MNKQDLIQLAATVGERSGWDFSRVRDAREPVPWDYMAVVPHYLEPGDRVLDVGTGGGERFLALAPLFAQGVGVDISAEMIETARENLAALPVDHVSFETMSAGELRFPPESFDAVLNRHSVVDVAETTRVLRPGGYLVNQEVGPRNAENICRLFGCGPGGDYDVEPEQETPALADAFRAQGCRVVCLAEYDVRYWFLDVESLLFWLQAVPIPEDFAIETHWEQVNTILDQFQTPEGIETNEQRFLLIVQKPPV